MVSDPNPKSVGYYKKSASLLLKDLRSTDATRTAAALARLRVLARSNLSVPDKLQRKHALTVVALEAGYRSWLELLRKQQKDAQLDFSEFFAAPRFGGFINHWFSTYSEAKSFQAQHGGLLLPYRNQCFVTTAEFIVALGMEQGDQDWRAIGYDWVEPENGEARENLQRRLQALHAH